MRNHPLWKENKAKLTPVLRKEFLANPTVFYQLVKSWPELADWIKLTKADSAKMQKTMLADLELVHTYLRYGQDMGRDKIMGD